MSLDDLVRQHQGTPRPKPTLGGERLTKKPVRLRKVSKSSKTPVKARATNKPTGVHKPTPKANTQKAITEKAIAPKAPTPTVSKKDALPPPASSVTLPDMDDSDSDSDSDSDLLSDLNFDDNAPVKTEDNDDIIDLLDSDSDLDLDLDSDVALSGTKKTNTALDAKAADMERRIAAIQANITNTQNTQAMWLDRLELGLAQPQVPNLLHPPERSARELAQEVHELRFQVFDLRHQMFGLQERLEAAKQVEAELIVDRKEACEQFRRDIGELRREVLGTQDWVGRLADGGRR